MAFPTSPTNGQQANINGITYTYSSTLTAWTVSTSVSNSFVSISVSGNVISGNIVNGGLISATGNVSGNYFVGNGSALTGIASGTPTAIVSGTSNVNVVSSGGNVTVGVGGTGNVAVWATTGEYITGVISASGNITGGNIITAGLISATGNITGNYIIGNGSQLVGLPASYGNANVVANLAALGSNPVSTTGNVTGGNVLTGGLISSAGTITGTSHLGGVVSVTANVTGGNILTAGVLSASGTVNFITASNVALGPVANVHITGGTTGQLLSTDGSGTLSWLTAGGASITNDTATNSNAYYPLFTTATSGSLTAANVANTKMYFNPSTGTLNATIFNSLSDETTKTNKQRIINALTKLLTLGGYTYLMIDSNEPSAGLLAQEVQKVLPEAVKYNPDTGLLTLNYNAVLGMVVEAINELEQRVSVLENAN